VSELPVREMTSSQVLLVQDTRRREPTRCKERIKWLKECKVAEAM
jgi:hypothetical protein